MGKELLTANEIINLKYKTIIFPTFGNIIFRDTYLYSDLYPKYYNYPVYQRNINTLKRLTENYYTVETDGLKADWGGKPCFATRLIANAKRTSPGRRIGSRKHTRKAAKMAQPSLC